MLQRIKGQETIITILVDGELQARIDSIKDSEVSFDLEILEEGYLGETANRFDSIFNGMTVRLTGHMTNRAFVQFVEAVVAKAQRRAGGAVRIDVATTLVFPGGDLVNIGVPDCSFGPAPLTTGGRSEYGEWTLEAKASEFEIF